ncbi:MAG: hypothetical protein ACI867_000323 [Glaciecola sp.]|jgi:hypothetical protein
MGIFARKAALPADLFPHWRAFLDCAEVIEAGRRTLLSTLPVGRVEPAPITFGLDALGRALVDADGWMPGWADVPALRQDHAACVIAMTEARGALVHVAKVADTTSELEVLQGAVEDVIFPLDAFADAERTWRRSWKILRD